MPPKTILLVDDNVLVRHLVRIHLESQPGFAIEEAADGVEAIEKAAKAKPDLIVLDLALPRMNGLQVAAALKGGSKHIPVILFTSYQDVIKELDARTLGISAVVSKSSSIEVLLNEIQRLVPATRPLLRRTKFAAALFRTSYPFALAIFWAM